MSTPHLDWFLKFTESRVGVFGCLFKLNIQKLWGAGAGLKQQCCWLRWSYCRWHRAAAERPHTVSWYPSDLFHFIAACLLWSMIRIQSWDINSVENMLKNELSDVSVWALCVSECVSVRALRESWGPRCHSVRLAGWSEHWALFAR